ncbi:hypothetical protein PENSPDRAFT_648737 [Peniophora sp. CONT]|nr:hypothetical protein PENSPDRAFT_648737 [Peniophora sp. CONT]
MIVDNSAHTPSTTMPFPSGHGNKTGGPPGRRPSAHMHPNVLQELFRYLVDLSTDSTLDALIAASHVCTTWRTLALDTPELWAQIPLRAGHAWAEEALRRSEPLPIVLRVPLTANAPRPREKTVLRVFRSLTRARAFSLLIDGHSSLVTPTQNDSSILAPLRSLEAPLPLLEELSLIFKNACPDAARVLSSRPLPKLRYLHVHNAWFSAPLFDSHTFAATSLSHIKLTGESPRAGAGARARAHSNLNSNGNNARGTVTEPPPPPPCPFPLPNISLDALTKLEAPRAQWSSLRSLLETLERMPNLELLQLANFVDPRGPLGEAWACAPSTRIVQVDGDGDVEMGDESVDGVARLNLGRGAPPARGLRMKALRRLALEGPCDSVAEVFASLALDVGAKLQFICHLPSPRTAAFLSSMRAAVLAHYASAPECFRQTSIGENVRCLYFSATDYEDLYKLYVELIDVAPQASSLLNEHLGFLRALLPEQPFGGLQTLYFNDVRVLESTPPWKEWRGTLRRVTLVHIQARATYGLVDALADRDMFPMLRTLSIKGDVDDSVLDPLVQNSVRQPKVEIRRRRMILGIGVG